MSNERRKQQKREKKKKKRDNANREARLRQASVQHSQRNALNTIIPRLSKLFEGKNPEIIRLAAREELTPDEIAERTGISANEAEAIVTEFLKLPSGIADKLVEYPEILAKPELLELMTGMNLALAQKMVSRLNQPQ